MSDMVVGGVAGDFVVFEGMYVIVATISKLLVANGWIYDGCPKCNKKAYGEGSSFVCVGCGNKSASIVAK